ncbi:MAG: tRNA pseudouridine(55) synthase TruB [Melioribacteraceae bacterium]
MKAITKKTITEIDPDFVSGEIVLIDKAFRKSSFDCVYKVRKAIEVKKVGHAGTLDPNATGLVIVCTGRMTKEISKIQELGKTYTGIITLGRTTPSFDAESDFDSERGFEHITEKDILDARDLFVGDISQRPPMFSAVKHNGQPLYKFARKGREIEREERTVTVSNFEIVKIDLPDIHFEISCSKGTYIRSIAHDFGTRLGCGAYLKELRRTGIGDFKVDDALTLDEFKEFAKNYTLVPQLN